MPWGMIAEDDKIDLAILRLVAPVAGTPLTKPPPLRFSRNDPVPMQECWVLGYPPTGGTTPTPVPVTFSFTDGNALKVTGAQIMPGHSGGPLVTKSGTVVGWNFRRNNELSHCQKIAAAEKCIRLVLTAPNAWEQLFASSEAESAHDRQQQHAVDTRTAGVEALKWAAGLQGVDVDTLQNLFRLRFFSAVTRSHVRRFYAGMNLAPHIDKLVSLMSTMTKLETLDLSGCNLGVNGAQITKLSGALRSCSLVTLDLSNNGYNQEEAVPLIESLPATMTTLCLDYRVRSLDNPCELCNALKQQQMTKQLEDRCALKRLTFKVTIDIESHVSAVPPELTLALASLVKEFPALEHLRLEANFSRRPNNQPNGSGGTHVFREAAKGRVSSTPLWLELPDYHFLNPCCLVVNGPHQEQFFPYWKWDQWAHYADGCTDYYDTLGPCARNALFCVECPFCILCIPCIMCCRGGRGTGCYVVGIDDVLGDDRFLMGIQHKPTAVVLSEAPVSEEMHRQTEDVEGSQMRRSSF